MVLVVGVRFKKAGKVYYFDPAEFPIDQGTKVIVETARGIEYGDVAIGPKQVQEDQVVPPLKKVLRVGTERDATVAAENKRKEKEAFVQAQRKISTHSLEMNLVDVEYTFDGSKVIFYFTAEGRVDFRELVKDLASLFRTRIEMRQIGVRDEAKLLGGIGPCGRILCCTSFLGDFAPVSIRMAKDQNLSLNPSKISGLCGRLMCCLRYEQETYDAAKLDPTLSPGYVKKVSPLLDVAILEAEDDNRPRSVTNFRSGESGYGARIAQALSMPERVPLGVEPERPPLLSPNRTPSSTKPSMEPPRREGRTDQRPPAQRSPQQTAGRPGPSITPGPLQTGNQPRKPMVGPTPQQSQGEPKGDRPASAPRRRNRRGNRSKGSGRPMDGPTPNSQE